MRTSCLLLALLACKGDDPAPSTGPAPLDLTVDLAPGQVRAGVVTDDRALFGGISAEGAPGDVKIYNANVRFVIQGLREGSFYVPQAGNVIDADIVRPPGQPGRDLVDEWLGMAGLGRLLQADKVTVVADGSDGKAAVVRAEGYESPLELLTGAVESPDLIADLGLHIVTEYRLEPDSPLLEVTTTYTATSKTATFTPGDGILGSADAAHAWRPGTGYDTYAGQPLGISAWVGKRNEGAVALLMPEGVEGTPGALEAVSGLFDVAAIFADAVTLEPGASTQFTRYYGVGPDVATLTDARLDVIGAETDRVEGTVTAADGPVAGARVTVLVDDAPYTLAFTAEDGSFSARVPAGASTSVLAEGRGPGFVWDLPEGAAPYSTYAAEPARRAALDSLGGGAVPIPIAEGRGAGSPEDPLTLGAPGSLVVQASDGEPFIAWVRFTEADPEVDRRLVRGRAAGLAASGASRDGELRLPVEPGTYEIVVHRGQRFEAASEVVTIAAGEETVLSVDLPAAFPHDGWLFGDPHCHASPSPDGGVPMEDRLVEQAGAGVQLHFGTDHDHISDYRPLVEPLGLDLATVVASEMSPVLRGHLNVYPLKPVLSAPNHGAFSWWREPVETTTEEFEILRERYGGPLEADAGFAIQVNHPVSAGLAGFAKWSPGRIGAPDYWATDFDVMELNNAGSYADYLELWLDLVARGHRIVPVGVTDSHHPFAGDPGLNATWFGFGTDDPAAYSDDALREVLLAGRTVVSRGVFLELSIDPGSEVVGAQTLEVEARSPSWATVDRLLLLQDGEVVETVDGNAATFSLDPVSDAFYVVIAEGDAPMAPVFPGRTPWAMANAIYVDVAGDGWTPPLPPLALEDDGSPPPRPEPHRH